MRNKEVFRLNPDENNLKNDGVVEINVAQNEILQYELKTFVCEGEYQRGIYRILDTYLKHIDQPKQPAVWVSGFFGSGKSHLVKMLGYLWENYHFPNGDTARNIKPLPQDVADLFVELDRKQKLNGALTVSGTFKDFPSNDIRYSFLQLLLNKLGLPQQFHLFKFIYWAMKEGIHDDLKAMVESQGKDFRKECENLFVSSTIAKSLLELKPEFAENEAKVKENFKVNFKRVESISREQLIDTVRSEILPLFFDKIPMTIIILDEVQQFIGSDSNKTIDIQNLAQDICSSFDGRFLLIGTGQNALSETPYLQPLQDRFSVKVLLSDTDVETVTRKTVLEKEPSAVNPIEKKLDSVLGEVSRNLSGTDYSYVTADKSTLVADYPILPSTRKFWKKILQVIDIAGTAGQLRSQLRIVDDSIKKVKDYELGQVVPADFIFEQKQQQLLQNALLLNETNTLIEDRRAKGGDSLVEARILSAVFLIDQLPKDVQRGRLKSDENTIADLLLDNLNENSEKLRGKVKERIQKLLDENVLMPVGDEYKLQTKVGAEWEQEYTSQAVKVNSSGDDEIQRIRKERIIAFFKEKTRAINILQGVSKQKREFDLWDKAERPNTESKLHLWIKDGWFENETVVLNEIRSEGQDVPLAYVFVKKIRDQELRGEIIKSIAADLTLQRKGSPSGNEGQQARRSMETRKGLADTAITELIEKICLDATVYVAGGNSIEVGTIKDNIEEALNNIAVRQFSEFQKADVKDWDKALNRALSGDPDALKKVAWDKEPKDHPVAIEILRFIGNNQKQGKEIRSHFMKASYGWSQDAIDAIIILLRNTEHISTQEPNLNQAKISNAAFKKEVHTLSASDKIKLRKLYQEAGILCKPSEEFLHSNTYLTNLKTLAERISGDAPKPEPINLQFVRDIENLDGNERLLRLLEEGEDLKSKYKEWSGKEALVDEREPKWDLLKELINYASVNPQMEKLKIEIDTIKEDRLLLHQPDLIEPKLVELTNHLKDSLNGLKETYNDLYDKSMAELQDSEYFSKLTPEQKHSILAKNQLLAKPEIKSLDAQGLLLQLQKASLTGWETKIAALPAQFSAALEEAIKLAAPKAQTFNMPRRTISSQADIDAYVAELKTELEECLKNAPSIILK